MQYYFINDLKKIGKVDEYIPYIYDNDKGWVVDNDNILMDRLMGYDFDRIGSTDLIEKVEEITEKRVFELIDN